MHRLAGRRHSTILRCAVLSSAAFVLAVPALAEPAARAELPVKQIVLPDGARRFSVSVKVGGTTIEAALDTGSVGLRVLPGVLKPDDAKATSQQETMRYGGGAMYEGVAANGAVEIAGLKGEVTLQLIEHVGCIPRLPDCAAARLSKSDYGIMGDGIPGAGFKAILGIGPRKIAIDNPLRRLGATRFIVELPRDKDEAGRLILNPSEAETTGFTQIPGYKRSAAQIALNDDAVTGCLSVAVGPGAKRDEAKPAAKDKNDKNDTKVCGAVTFDSGAPGMRIVSPDSIGQAWPQGTKIDLALEDGAGKSVLTDTLTVGGAKDLTRLTFKQMEFLPKTIIRLGVAPYMTYAVLYDLDRGGFAVKARAPKP